MTHYDNRIAPLLKGKTIDFTVVAARKNLPKQYKFLVVFGAIWLVMFGIMLATTLRPLFVGGNVTVTINGTEKIGNLAHTEPIMPFILFAILLFLLGVIPIIAGIYKSMQKGGTFIGTDRELIYYDLKEIKITPWTAFNGQVFATGNEQKGNLQFFLKTGRVVKSKYSSTIVANEIVMVGIPDLFNLQNKCLARINASS